MVVVGPERVTYHEPARDLHYFYHPGMAKVRLHSHRRGDPDPMIQAMDAQPGDEVLDCTLGRASDALLVSWVVGETGRVVGLEASAVLAALVRDGIARYADPSAALTAALRRIRCQWADYREYLPECPDGAFDVVYFDPLFDEPLETSPAMAPLRLLAERAPLTAETVAEAARVARRRVVIKQRRGSGLWHRIPVDRVVHGRSARVEYGVRLARPHTGAAGPSRECC
ncbi:MAG: class I SAM-dependent methyltransferase [Armatimonadetes bacterium]|nr:class I SAM-dependent methyltransferase [Armatimonadota bacterium]